MSAISKEVPEFSDFLMNQYSASVKKREFTGHGFFTDFEYSGTDRLPDTCGNTELGDLSVMLNGFCLVGFVLFIKNGTITCLEGYTYGDKWPDVIEDCRFLPMSRQRFI